MILAVRIGNISRFTIWRKWWILNRCGSSTFFTAIRRPLTVNSYLDRYMIRVLRYPHQYDLKKTNSAHKFSHRCIRNIITGRNRQGAGWRFPRRPHPSAISRGPHHLIKRFFIFTETHGHKSAKTQTNTQGAHYLSNTQQQQLQQLHTPTHTDTYRQTHRYSLTKTFWHSDTVLYIFLGAPHCILLRPWG